MKTIHLAISTFIFFQALNSFGNVPDKYISVKSHIVFFSTTPVEDIEANNFASVSTIRPETGEVVFSVPMQSFEFEKALMQQHFNNEHFLETNVYPKAKFTGKITNLSDIDFAKDGSYTVEIEGKLTIKGTTRPMKQTGTIMVKGDYVNVFSKFNLVLADFGIAFDEKEMVSKKIAKQVEVTVNAEYIPE